MINAEINLAPEHVGPPVQVLGVTREGVVDSDGELLFERTKPKGPAPTITI